jgi:hypothetical protein
MPTATTLDSGSCGCGFLESIPLVRAVLFPLTNAITVALFVCNIKRGGGTTTRRVEEGEQCCNDRVCGGECGRRGGGGGKTVAAAAAAEAAGY